MRSRVGEVWESSGGWEPCLVLSTHDGRLVDHGVGIAPAIPHVAHRVLILTTGQLGWWVESVGYTLEQDARAVRLA